MMKNIYYLYAYKIEKKQNKKTSYDLYWWGTAKYISAS